MREVPSGDGVGKKETKSQLTVRGLGGIRVLETPVCRVPGNGNASLYWTNTHAAKRWTAGQTTIDARFHLMNGSIALD